MTKNLLMSAGWFFVGVIATYIFLAYKTEDIKTLNTENISTESEFNFDDSLTSVEYARLGDKTWTSFECTALSAFLEKDESDIEKLFTEGYESGLAFIEALRKELVTDEDIQSEVPIGLTWQLNGPTSDFMLGKIYNTAEDNVLEDVYKDGNDFIESKEIQINIAETKYNRANCNLLL